MEIMVIDSEPTVRTVVTTILERAGYQVKNTGDFAEALELLRQRKPDLVLTNVFLRGITGHDAMHRLKQEFPDLNVLMVSGLPDESVIKSWASEPNFDIFPKPFTSEALLAKVTGILGSKPANPSGASKPTG